MQLYPSQQQISLGRQLLETWDMIIGHHSHCPQPIASYSVNGRNKLLAYSLGDFTFGMNVSKYLSGLIVKVELGPGSDGQWAVGEVQWSSIAIKPSKEYATISRHSI